MKQSCNLVLTRIVTPAKEAHDNQEAQEEVTSLIKLDMLPSFKACDDSSVASFRYLAERDYTSADPFLRADKILNHFLDKLDAKGKTARALVAHPSIKSAILVFDYDNEDSESPVKFHIDSLPLPQALNWLSLAKEVQALNKVRDDAVKALASKALPDMRLPAPAPASKKKSAPAPASAPALDYALPDLDATDNQEATDNTQE